MASTACAVPFFPPQVVFVLSGLRGGPAGFLRRSRAHAPSAGFDAASDLCDTLPSMAVRDLKAVFFDVGGTLIAPRPSFPDIYSRVLVPLGIRVAAGDFQRAARETWGEFDALVGRGRDRYSHFEGGEREYWSRFVRRVLERVSQAEKAEEAAEILNETFSDPGVWSVFPEVRSTLRALHERGLRLGIISNWDSRLRRTLSGLGLAEAFETIVVSCEVGVEKPAAA